MFTCAYCFLSNNTPPISKLFVLKNKIVQYLMVFYVPWNNWCRQRSLIFRWKYLVSNFFFERKRNIFADLDITTQCVCVCVHNFLWGNKKNDQTRKRDKNNWYQISSMTWQHQNDTVRMRSKQTQGNAME